MIVIVALVVAYQRSKSSRSLTAAPQSGYNNPMYGEIGAANTRQVSLAANPVYETTDPACKTTDSTTILIETAPENVYEVPVNQKEDLYANLPVVSEMEV